MADSPFRGDFAFRQMEEERLSARKRLRRERRMAVFDFTLSIGGVIACLFHLHAPWFFLFQMFGIAWTLYFLLVICISYVSWNVYELVIIQRSIRAENNTF